MRKLYYLACSIVLSGLTACEVPPLADGSSAETAEGVATAPISHTIPAAKALEHLAGALVALDGPTVLRVNREPCNALRRLRGTI